MNSTARSPISLPGRVVVFDYGEVISVEPTAANRAELLAIAGVADVDADAFWTAYWAPRALLDAGTISIREYWDAVAATMGRQWGAATVHLLWVCDVTGWMSVNTATLAVIERLVAGGTRTALLSNAGADYSGFFRNGSFGHLFERHFISGELHLVKPDAAIYQHVLDALGITADQMIFIDNRADNIAGAEDLGITGHVFTSAEELGAFLETAQVEGSA